MIEQFFSNLFQAYKDQLAQIPDNYAKYLTYLPYLLFFFIVSLLLTPLFGKIATMLNIYDLPPEERKNKKMLNKHDDPSRHIHKHKVPFLGGLAVVLPFIIYVAILTPQRENVLVFFLIGLIILTINGVIDDAFNLPGVVQFAIQFIAGVLIAISVVDLSTLNLPFNIHIPLELARIETTLSSIPISFIIPGDFLLVLWIMICINAVKWMGGSDGLLESNCIVALILIYLVTVRDFDYIGSFFSIILVGSMIGYLVFNYPPAKIFTGCTGKSAYGYILAVMAVMSKAKFAVTLVILGLPLLDFVYVVIKRLVVYKPKNPLAILRINSRDHLHHKLLDLGFSNKKVILIETTSMLLIGLFGFYAIGAKRFIILIVLGILVLGAIFLLDVARKKYKAKKDTKSPESKYSY